MASLALDQQGDAASVLKKLKDKPKESAVLLSKMSNIPITPKDIKKGAPSAFKTMGKLEQKAEMGEEPSAEDLNDLKDAPEIEKKEEKPWSEDSKKKVFMALSASLPIIIGGAFGGAEGASMGAKTGAGILGEIGRKEEEAAKAEREQQDKMELTAAKADEAAKLRERGYDEARNNAMIMAGMRKADRKEELADRRMYEEEQKAKAAKAKQEQSMQEVNYRKQALLNNAEKLKELIKKAGTFELLGPESEQMDSLIYQIAVDQAKLVDPTSVAREGEVAAAQKYMLPVKGLGVKNSTALKLVDEFIKGTKERAGTIAQSKGLGSANVGGEPDFDNMSDEELKAFLEQ